MGRRLGAGRSGRLHREQPHFDTLKFGFDSKSNNLQTSFAFKRRGSHRKTIVIFVDDKKPQYVMRQKTNFGTTGDGLKPLGEIMLADVRQQYWGRVEPDGFHA